MTKLAAVLLLALSVYVLTVNGLKGGFENFLCGRSPNATLFFPCATDCQHQHGAVTGDCEGVRRGDFNCHCKGRAKTRYDGSLQCTEQSDDFRQICNIDCICHHGAKGGFCDWDMKACICQGQGTNTDNVNCPFDDIPNYALFVVDRAGEEALGPHGMKFIGPLLKKREQEKVNHNLKFNGRGFMTASA